MDKFIEKLKHNKNTTALILILVLLGLSYWFFLRGDEPLISVTSTASSDQIVGRELLIELQRLKSLNQVNVNFFDSEVFKSLEDTTVLVTPQPIGRNNPFISPSLE